MVVWILFIDVHTHIRSESLLWATVKYKDVISSNFRFSPCIIIVNHFYCPTNAFNYTNLEVKIYVVQKYKRQKIKKLKITPTCFGSYVIHHQVVQSCA